MLSKNFWPYIAAVLFIIILIITNCVSCKKIKQLQFDCDQKLLKSDTVTVHDTVYSQTEIAHKPKPVKVTPAKNQVRTEVAVKPSITQDRVITVPDAKDYTDTA